MMGFQNANYWSSAVDRSPGKDSLPHGQLRQHVTTLAKEFETSAAVQNWCTQNGLTKINDNDEHFDARDVHQLCATVLRQNPKDETCP